MRLSRREFITWSVGGAFLLASGRASHAATPELSPWIRIDPDGSVHLYSSVTDMGQGSLTGQIQVLADELDVAWDAIHVEMAPDAEPFRDDGELFTGGSRSLSTRYALLRAAGATARARLLLAAANRWDVDRTQCRAELGEVVDTRSGRRLRYGELAALAAAVAAPSDASLKSRAEQRYIGKSLPPLGQADKVRGRAVYGIDVRVPGMLRATLRQCPVFGGTLVRCDDAPALAMEGVRKVVRLPSAVAVIADNTWIAFRAAQALAPEWSMPTQRSSSAAVTHRLRVALDAKDAEIAPRDTGIAARTRLRSRFAASSRRVEASYELPYLAHSPLEPMNATAHVTRDRVEVWAPTQAQTAVRNDVAKALARHVDDVVLHTTCLGGGFGRRLKTDYAVFAALVAREVDVPVQLTWTREEDLAHDFYRPASLLTCRAAIEPDGRIRGYEMVGATTDDKAFGGAGPAPYALPDFAATQSQVGTGIPVGAWRSVDASITVFAKESFIDECAHAAGANPLEYRRRLLGGNARALRLLDAVADRINWRGAKDAGRGIGLALCQGWDTLVAHAIEVRVADGRLTVLRIVVAADPGTIVNPGLVRAQFEGGALMALGAALQEEITAIDGAVVQRNFDTYRLLRMAQAPSVEVVLFESHEAKIGGVGEPPIPGVAPALVNAIFAACGRRIRKLPIRGSGLDF
ncbi:MAG: molybdopterin cofactor-binding domain-containing protein [Rudaea sp.]